MTQKAEDYSDTKWSFGLKVGYVILIPHVFENSVVFERVYHVATDSPPFSGFCAHVNYPNRCAALHPTSGRCSKYTSPESHRAQLRHATPRQVDCVDIITFRSDFLFSGPAMDSCSRSVGERVVRGD